MEGLTDQRCSVLHCTVEEHLRCEQVVYSIARAEGIREGKKIGHRQGYDAGYIHGFTEGSRSSSAFKAGAIDGWADGFMDRRADLSIRKEAA